MKTTLKTLFTAAILRPLVYFQLCSLRINLDGMLQARVQVTDPATRHAMSRAISVARVRLDELQARYIALRPARSWRVVS